MKLRKLLGTVTVYLTVVLAALSLATWRMQAQGEQNAAQPAASPQAAASPQPSATPVKPHFSLSTNRAYGTQEKTRIYINYQGIDSLDFRVYKIRDPFKFFKQLANPHQMGDSERELVSEVVQTENHKPGFLEKLRSFKSGILFGFKNYFRTQIRRESRATFNDKFRSGEREPINVATYAQMPLLNPDQLEDSFRQLLTPLDSRWDTRMVTLGQKKPGVYLVEAVNAANAGLRAYTVAVVTDLTMVSKISQDGEMLVYTVDRKTGEPRNDTTVEIVKGRKILATGKTDKNGLLRVGVKPQKDAAEQDAGAEPPPDQELGPNEYLILVNRKDDFAVSDLASYYFSWNEGDGEEGGRRDLSSYIYTDRPVYRPEQKAYFKGILRKAGDGGYEMLKAGSVSVSVTNPEGNEIFKRDLPLSARGTFSGEVDLAANAPLGGYSVVVNQNGREAARGFFEIAEYKKPEYKVKVTTPKQFVNAGEKTKYTVEAKYFFGAPVKNADVKYYIYRSNYYPWWFEDEDDGLGGEEEGEGEEEFYGFGNDMVKEGEGHLNEAGLLEIPFDVPPPEKNQTRDFSYRIEVTVTDSARREIEAKTSFVGTRGNVIVNAQPERYVYLQNDTARVKIKATDYEGKPIATKVSLSFLEVTYERKEIQEGEYKRVEYKRNTRELSTGETQTNSQGEATFDYRATTIGSIAIEAVVNEAGRQVKSAAGSLYVTDRNNGWADRAYRDSEAIKLVPDKKSYKPGETARILAMLPTDKAHLLVTTELQKVLDVRHIFAEGRVAMIELPIKESFSPNIYLSVTYVRDGQMYEHSRSISVPAAGKFLDITLMPDKREYKPRDPASYTITAKNADGSPAVGAEVSLGLVDEAIYSIRPDTSGDIRRAFYGRRYAGVSTSFSAAFQFTGYSGNKRIQLAMNKPSYQLADFKNDSQLVEPKIRKEFKDTAFWQPNVVTGADGTASVKINLPDNLTTWRATARAVTADLKVGSKVDRVLSRKDLILRLETPRFATEGDVLTVSGIVHNYLNAEKVTQVELKVTGADLVGQPQQTVTIPQNGETRIDWQLSAKQMGEVVLLATAKTNAESDGIELKMPIIPAGTKITKGESLALAEDNADKQLSLPFPNNAHAQARSLRIEASPSIAGAMFGALDYLTGYPYGCVEQTMSRFLPNVIVAQTLKDVKTASIATGNDLSKKVKAGLDKLYGFQHEDGGWGWWKDDKTDAFMTAYVMDGLAIAQRAGYGVDSYVVERGRRKLQQLLDTGKMEDGTPFDFESRAYLLYAQQISGGADSRAVTDLFNRRGELQPYGRALLALTLKLRNDNRAQLVASDIERTARLSDYDASWTSKRKLHFNYIEENDLEATALSLKALAQINPQSELPAKAARWLVAHRRNGYYWETTKHTAFAIYALTDYLRVSRELSADYSLEVYWNGEQVLNKRVTAAEAAGGLAVTVERKGDKAAPANLIRVVKRGAGVAYVAATLDYFTKEEPSAQSANGMNVTREYLRLSVAEKDGKPSWQVAPLTGELRSGDVIVSKLRVTGTAAQYLLLEDPIPAGCEQIENFSGLNLNYTAGNNWTDWYSFREFRDQRTAIFLDRFDGDATFQYAMRVQVPGQFRVAPARAELMYQPSVRANTANVRLNILEKK
ncbi:MAG TPA: alpha-2-macroglobulin family protein [Blastocatellia bacterium]|nr:alpha-2-macroglobulin family protein [Blastocatellia bacterium]